MSLLKHDYEKQNLKECYNLKQDVRHVSDYNNYNDLQRESGGEIYKDMNDYCNRTTNGEYNYYKSLDPYKCEYGFGKYPLFSGRKLEPCYACCNTDSPTNKAEEEAEAARLAEEKAEQERIAAEKAEQDALLRRRRIAAARLAAEKAEQERIAAEKAEQERIAAEKAETARLAAEKAEQERIAAEEEEEEEDKEEENVGYNLYVIMWLAFFIIVILVLSHGSQDDPVPGQIMIARDNYQESALQLRTLLNIPTVGDMEYLAHVFMFIYFVTLSTIN